MTEDHSSDEVGTEDLGDVCPIEVCPRCDGREFVIDLRHDAPTFRCLGCGTLWKYELGYVWSMD